MIKQPARTILNLLLPSEPKNITFQVIVITATKFSVKKIAYFLSESGASFMTVLLPDPQT